MTKPAAESCERALAMLVVAACVLAVVVEGEAVGATEQALTIRSQQLLELHGMQANGAVGGAVPVGLDGLFERTSLRWHCRGAATFLQLQPLPGSAR